MSYHLLQYQMLREMAPAMHKSAIALQRRFGPAQPILDNFGVTKEEMKMTISKRAKMRWMDELDVTAERYKSIGHLADMLDDIRIKISKYFLTANKLRNARSNEVGIGAGNRNVDGMDVGVLEEEEEDDDDLDLNGVNDLFPTPRARSSASQRSKRNSASPMHPSMFSQSSQGSAIGSFVGAESLSEGKEEKIMGLFQQIMDLSGLNRKYRITERLQLAPRPVPQLNLRSHAQRKRRREHLVADDDEIEADDVFNAEEQRRPPPKKRVKRSQSARSSKNKGTEKKKKVHIPKMLDWKYTFGRFKGTTVKYDAKRKASQAIKAGERIKHSDWLMTAATTSESAATAKFHCEYAACTEQVGLYSMEHHSYRHAIKKEVDPKETHKCWNSRAGCMLCNTAIAGTSAMNNHLKSKNCKDTKFFIVANQEKWPSWVPADRIAHFSKKEGSAYSEALHDPNNPFPDASDAENRNVPQAANANENEENVPQAAIANEVGVDDGVGDGKEAEEVSQSAPIAMEDDGQSESNAVNEQQTQAADNDDEEEEDEDLNAKETGEKAKDKEEMDVEDNDDSNNT